MSYRAFKRLLGETSLERKCRFLLGGGIIVLMSVSFWLYARQTEGLAYEQMNTSARLLVPPILAREHLPADARSAVDDFQRQSETTWPDALGNYSYKILKTDARLPEHKPTGDDVSIVNRLAADPNLIEQARESTAGTFHHFTSIRATASCVECHNKHPEFRMDKPIAEGDLIAVVKVTLSTKPIETGIHVNRALLLSFALVSAILIMAGSYLVIRYVVVKPVKHLKSVSDAIVGGQFNVRSDIHTGDEFQDLSDAFNRMVRHLMDLQEDQKKLNSTLDRRVADLAQANLALFESNRAKGDFLSTVSHELRTPLNGIIGFSDVLLSPTSPLTEKQARWVVNIRESGRQLLTLINDILDLAKIEAGKMEVKAEVFAVPEFVERLLVNFRLAAEKKAIDIRFHYAQTMPTVRQDAGKVRQILVNLLSNAVKFTPEGGRVVLRVSIEEAVLVVVVSDTGVGIPAEECERVFEKFRQSGSTLTREHEGTGLGLSIVRELCALLGGSVELKSELGRGTTFTVRLPAQYEPQPEKEFKREIEKLGMPDGRSTVTAMAPVSLG